MANVCLGPFEIQEKIGQGGMATVFHGTHVGDGADVAIKILTFPDGPGHSFQ